MGESGKHNGSRNDRYWNLRDFIGINTPLVPADLTSILGTLAYDAYDPPEAIPREKLGVKPEHSWV